jgi:hypothetical protein
MQAKRALILSAVSLLLLVSTALGQQTYVGHFDVYMGAAYLGSPAINLGETGVHLQVGMRPTHWYSMGFDYTRDSGTTSLIPTMLLGSLQQQLNAQLAPLQQAGWIPAGYKLAVPLDSTTETFSAGPQIAFRHFKAVTIFVRPDLGAMHETAVVHPKDTIARMVVAQLSPSGTKQDWTPFYGFGGGVDLNLTNHFSLRVQADFVHDHLFNDLLPGRNTVRLAIGPGFQWGKNMAAR